jgi:hypothetical protein
MATKPTPGVPTPGFSQAKLSFDRSIGDAEQLLDHCETQGGPLPHSAEVFVW